MPFYFLPILIISLIACCIEVDISVPGFPDMAQYFQVEEGVIQMTIAFNFLGFCLGAAIYGPLSDTYGRRPVMVWGNAILALGAVGCVLAPSIPFLLGTRFIQGIGASASAVVVFAMIADAYPAKDKAASLIGFMNAVFSCLMAIAPIAGGFVNEAVGWRGNYGIVAAICLLSWVALILLLPETRRNAAPLQNRKTRENYQKLLRNFTFISASLVPSLSYAAYLSFIAQASFLYTETFHLSLAEYVIHQFVIVFLFSLVSLFSGKAIKFLGSQGCIVKGTLISATGMLCLVALTLIHPNVPYLMTAFMGIICLGAAISYPVVFSTSMDLFPDMKGTASSVIMSMRSFLCFTFTGLTGYLYTGHPVRISLIIALALLPSILLTVSLLRSPQFMSLISRQSAP